MRRPFLIPAFLLCLGFAGCSLKPGFVNEYKIDIQQGNVLTQDMVTQLKPGQSREQVRFILGSPMITDIFHQQRWDYPYRYKNGQTGAVESRQFSVFFDADGRLERVAGDVEVGTAAELTAPVARTQLIDLGTLSAEEAAKPITPPEEPGFFRRWMSKLGF